MKKYKILENKANLKIQVFGRMKEELFKNALSGMASALRAETENEKAKAKRITIESVDLSALLVDFLSEALYLIQVHKEIYNEVRFIEFSDNELTAELNGQKVERFGEDIKAVTHHGLDIRENKKGIWEATILFDI